MTTLRLGLLLAAIAIHAPAQARSGEGLPPIKAWKRGELWPVRVEVLHGANRPPPFKMWITVNGKNTKTIPIECWRLLFNPFKESGLDLHYFVYVDEKMGALQGIQRLVPNKHIDEKIDPASYMASIQDRLRAFPFELFPSGETTTPPGSPLKANVETRREGDKIVVEARIVSERDQVRIRQVWLPRELWWREYERSLNGVKMLSARRDEPPLKLPAKKPLGPSSIVRENPFYLRYDPKLQALVSVSAGEATLPRLLEILQKASTLAITIDPGLKQKHGPELTGVQMQGVPCFGLMEFLASHELEKGRWLKTPKGYELVGVSLSKPVPIKTVADKKPVEPATAAEAEQPGYEWAYFALGAVGVAFIILPVILLRGRRAAKA